jgi:hypothetical protein
MLHHIKKLFGIKPKAVEAEVPYKVETPAPTPSPSPAVEAMVTSIAVEGAGQVDIPAEKPTKKKPAAKKAPAAKKPRAPKKPKPV